MKKFIAFLAVALLLTAPLTGVHAAQFERGETVTIPAQQIMPQNLYAVGGQVTVSTTAQKDLVVAGGRVISNGPVWGDILIAGGTVDILEGSRGDVRVAGGQVTIQGLIGGDVTVVGGEVTILPGTTIAGDLFMAGGKVTVEATVNGQTKIYGGDVMVNAMLAGPVFITSGKEVVFGDKTVIGSTLNYTAPQESVPAAGAKLGDKVTFTVREMPAVNTRDIGKVLIAVVTALFVIKLISIALTSVVAVSLFKNFSFAVSSESLTKFWQMLLVGLLATVAGPVAAILLMVTVVGAYLGAIVGALYLLAALLGGLYACIVTGALIAKLVKKELRVNWKWALLGTLILFVVSLVPVLGWVAAGVMYFVAFGAVITVLYREVKSKM